MEYRKKARSDSVSTIGIGSANMHEMSPEGVRELRRLCGGTGEQPVRSGAISQSVMLAADERGLATMPAVELVRYPEVLRSYLDIPDSLSVAFGIAIGYENSLHPINKFESTRRAVSDVEKFRGVE